jgi:hypothetical protein
MKGDTKYNNHTKLLLKKYEELKKKFSECKTYTDKLIFWDNNNLKHYINTYPIEFPSQLYEEHEELVKKYSITIKPTTPEEEEHYTYFRIKTKTDELIDEYYKVLENKKKQSEKKDFINIQLKDIEKIMNNDSSDVAISFHRKTKGKEAILGKHNYSNWNKIVEGIALYHFKHFLIEEQNILTSPEATIKHKTSNKKLIWNAPKNVLGEIFFQLKKELKNPNNGKPYIEGNDDIIAEMLCNYFSNIDKKETFISYLNPSKTYNKPQKVKVKISIEELNK